MSGVHESPDMLRRGAAGADAVLCAPCSFQVLSIVSSSSPAQNPGLGMEEHLGRRGTRTEPARSVLLQAVATRVRSAAAFRNVVVRLYLIVPL